MWWALRPRQRRRLGSAGALTPSNPTANALRSAAKVRAADPDPGRGPAVESAPPGHLEGLLGSAKRKKGVVRGLRPRPFPGTAQGHGGRWSVSPGRAVGRHFPSRHRGLPDLTDPSRPGKAAARVAGISGKGGRGGDQQAGAGKALPLLGRTLMQGPTPRARALHPRFRQPRRGSREGAERGWLILIRGPRWRLGAGRRLASLGPGPEPVCWAVTPKDSTNFCRRTFLGAPSTLLRRAPENLPSYRTAAKFHLRHRWLGCSLFVHSFILWLQVSACPSPFPIPVGEEAR